MIVATAGHVDHGKTLLVKALTGVDTDRLPEEKERGMTIDLGFAYLPVESNETIGFVDVPGHERFVHNMMAGVAGIDFALFVIAADDGPMPQTREHLAILDLLGIDKGAVALTKIDRVTESRVTEVRNEIASLLSPTTLAGAPVIPVSAVTGEGIENLKSYLVAAAQSCRPRSAKGNFRLAIDRCFSISGAGLIVTGTAVAGSVATGDAVRVLQADVTVRARAIHAQNAVSETGRAGQRCAINLAGPGLKRELIQRGDWVVTGDVPEPVQKFDARLRVLRGETRPLAHWTPLHVHLGAADVTGRVAILEGSGIAPGESALVQLVLDRPIGALYGDGLIVRDQSAQRTIGGGRVIDIFPPVRGRAKPERLAYLAAMENGDAQAAVSALVNLESPRGSLNSPRGLNLSRFSRNRNLTAQEAEHLIATASARCIVTPSGTLAFSLQEWAQIKTKVVETLTALHRCAPGAIFNDERVFQEAGIRVPKEVATAIMAELNREGVVVRDPSGVRLKAHLPQLNAADAVLWKRAEALFQGNPLQPPSVHTLAGALAVEPAKTESFLVRLSRLGWLVRTAENRFFLPAGLRRYAAFVEEVAAGNHGSVTAAKLRDRAGIGRGPAIEVLEYFDRIKFTRRVGDEHQVIRPARDVFGDG
ncbi:MAG TPA: selenocysteine-specific translation elongation factor [Bryobacteraceae bacterium]|nr:selenocysteine-specific translation elongation factor [Bryobacteraceae bacterium]